jgi:cardiolipin synthase
VGSTNLNFASLVSNWELDLVAEDSGFATKMEELFEEDLLNAREVRLGGTAEHPRVRPERPIKTSDRDARRGVAGSGSGGSATILRVGSTALQKSGYPLETHEQALAAAASGTLLGASLLALRFPHFLAWPLAAAGALYGGLGVLRAARSTLSDRRTERAASKDAQDSGP